MESPLVSVVIPSYNHEKYVGKTIDSIIGQSIKNLELIVIDDESSDNSVELIQAKIQEYAHRKITLISRPNKGICRTLNEGLRMSTGVYFSYCGSDDYWHPLKLEKQISAFDRHGGNYAASYTDSFIIDETDQVIGRYGLQAHFRGGDMYWDLVSGKFQPASPTTLFYRHAIVGVGGFNEQHFIEDRDLWIRIARIYNVAYVDEPLAFYRTHGTNTSTQNMRKMQACTQDAFERACTVDPILNVRRRRIQAKMDANVAGNYYTLLQLPSARALAVKSILGNPFEILAWRTFILSFFGEKLISSLRKRRQRKLVTEMQTEIQ